MIDTINSVPISVIVSHQSELVEEVCNRFILIEKGVMVEDTRDKQLLEDYRKSMELEAQAA